MRPARRLPSGGHQTTRGCLTSASRSSIESGATSARMHREGHDASKWVEHGSVQSSGEDPGERPVAHIRPSALSRDELADRTADSTAKTADRISVSMTDHTMVSSGMTSGLP